MPRKDPNLQDPLHREGKPEKVFYLQKYEIFLRVHKELYSRLLFFVKRFSKITSYIIEVSLKTNFDVKLVSRKID